jgi:hypothetical protein
MAENILFMIRGDNRRKVLTFSSVKIALTFPQYDKTLTLTQMDACNLLRAY